MEGRRRDPADQRSFSSVIRRRTSGNESEWNLIGVVEEEVGGGLDRSGG